MCFYLYITKIVKMYNLLCYFFYNWASILPKCLDESFGSSQQMYNLIPKYLQCIRKILQVRNKFIACVEISYSMYTLDGLDSCIFCNGCV